MVRTNKLKKKLALLKLSTVGTKVELQQRMRTAMEEEIEKSEDQLKYGSDDGSARLSECLESSSGCSENSDMSQMLEAIQKIMLENSVQLLEMENKFHDYTQRQENLLAEQQKSLEEKLKKQREITDCFYDKVQKLQKCIDKMQERITYLEGKQTENSNEKNIKTENGERIILSHENSIDELFQIHESGSLTDKENSIKLTTSKEQHLDKSINERITYPEKNQTTSSDEKNTKTEKGQVIILYHENSIDELHKSGSLTDKENTIELTTLKEQHFDENIYEKIKELETEIRDLQIKTSVTQCIKFQPPTFDGTTSFSLFRLQFETAIKANQWNDKERLAALVLALRAGALVALQTLPKDEKSSYEALMNALKHKYDNEHMKRSYRMLLKNRIQSCTETLQEYAVEIERLAHMAYDIETPKELLEQYKIDAFTNGILNPATKYAALTSPKINYAESIANALTQETTASLAGHSLIRDDLTKSLCEAVKTAIRTELQTCSLNHKT